MRSTSKTSVRSKKARRARRSPHLSKRSVSPLLGSSFGRKTLLRILHTADWHLGQALHGVSRAHEHALFFSFLETSIEEHEVDALIVAGDVFDVANPSPSALSAYYELLARLRRRFPRLDI